MRKGNNGYATSVIKHCWKRRRPCRKRAVSAEWWSGGPYRTEHSADRHARSAGNAGQAEALRSDAAQRLRPWRRSADGKRKEYKKPTARRSDADATGRKAWLPGSPILNRLTYSLLPRSQKLGKVIHIPPIPEHLRPPTRGWYMMTMLCRALSAIAGASEFTKNENHSADFPCPVARRLGVTGALVCRIPAASLVCGESRNPQLRRIWRRRYPRLRYRQRIPICPAHSYVEYTRR